MKTYILTNKQTTNIVFIVVYLYTLYLPLSFIMLRSLWFQVNKQTIILIFDLFLIFSYVSAHPEWQTKILFRHTIWNWAFPSMKNHIWWNTWHSIQKRSRDTSQNRRLTQTPHLCFRTIVSFNLNPLPLVWHQRMTPFCWMLCFGTCFNPHSFYLQQNFQI